MMVVPMYLILVACTVRNRDGIVAPFASGQNPRWYAHVQPRPVGYSRVSSRSSRISGMPIAANAAETYPHMGAAQWPETCVQLPEPKQPGVRALDLTLAMHTIAKASKQLRPRQGWRVEGSTARCSCCALTLLPPQLLPACPQVVPHG